MPIARKFHKRNKNERQYYFPKKYHLMSTGQYVGFVVVNWILGFGSWNCYSQFGKAGAKIGKITFNILSQFLGNYYSKKKCAVFTAHFLLFFFLILKSKDKDNGDYQCV